MHHNLTGWGEGLMFLVSITYFPIAAIESQVPAFPIVYKFWEESISSPTAWYGAILSICTLYTVDIMLVSLFNFKLGD